MKLINQWKRKKGITIYKDLSISVYYNYVVFTVGWKQFCRVCIIYLQIYFRCKNVYKEKKLKTYLKKINVS